MKKTLTVNLGGSVFNIDEDAYQLLDQYLSNLRSHFRKEDGSEEIMNDFELRISELLNEKMRLGYAVVDIEMIETIISRMGKPEDIFGDEQTEQQTEEQKTINPEATVITSGKRRLFRNPDDKIIGGVASGFAAYMGWDATAIRIALLILLFFTQIVIIPVYLILWLVIPMAKTASERLEMRGENVTLENIGKTVTSGFEKVSEGVNSYVKSEKPRNFIQKLADIFVQIMGILLKIAFIILAIILAPMLLILLFVLLIVIFCMLFGGAALISNIFPKFHWIAMNMHYPQYTIIWMSIGCFLLIGIPVGTMLYAITGKIFNFSPISTTAKWTLFILWLIGTILSIACGTMMWTSHVNAFPF